MRTLKIAAAAAVLALASFASAAFAADKGTIGIAMPDKSVARWIDDGNNMVATLKAEGYGSDLQYAEDDIPNQLAQIEGMITKKVKVLVIAAVDGSTLTAALAKAHDAGIKVIAYDRLIRDSENVDYYATFDNFHVGVLQGQSLEKGLGLKDGKGPFNIELFAGSPDDNNAGFFFNGAMTVLKPYIDSGKLVVRSKQVAFDKVATPRWDSATAQGRMDALLSAYYGKDRVNAVLAPNDGLAIGVLSSLKAIGYGSKDQPMPLVTGQDCEIPSVKSILSGGQYSSIFKDTRALAKVTASMVNALVAGTKPEINDTKTYDNGKKIVPAYLLKPVAVDASNAKAVLIESGYYTAKQLQ